MSTTENHEAQTASGETISVPESPAHRDARQGPVFWVGLCIGMAMIGYGLRGVWASEATTRPINLGTWGIGLLIFHDLLLAPVVFGVVALGNRFRILASPYVRGAVATSALLAFITFPLIRGYGVRDDNATLLPLDYRANLIGALVVVWTIAIAAAVIAHGRNRSGRRR